MTPARKFQLFFSAWQPQGKKKSSEQIVPQRSGVERSGVGAERSGAERSRAGRRAEARRGAQRSGAGAARSAAERSGAQQSGTERSGAERSGAEGGLYAEVDRALHKILEKASQAADPRSPLLILQGTASPALQTGPWATDR